MTLSRPSRPWLSGFVVMLALLSSGCPTPTRIGGGEPLDAVLDDLRYENEELRGRIRALERQRDHLLGQVRTLEQRLDRRAHLPEVSPGEIPAAARIAFARHSGALDSSGDGRDDTLRLYVQTFDQKGRFIPIVGRADLQAVALRPGQDPLLVLERTWEPPDFSRAYRSGLTGTHYTLEAPLPDDLPEAITELTVNLTVTDAATGAELRRQMVVPLGERAAAGQDEEEDVGG